MRRSARWSVTASKWAIGVNVAPLVAPTRARAECGRARWTGRAPGTAGGVGGRNVSCDSAHLPAA